MADDEKQALHPNAIRVQEALIAAGATGQVRTLDDSARTAAEAAAALGVRVGPLKFLLYVLAGFGCGAAGALTLANTLFIQPRSIFGVQWSAYMIFMVLVGGLGTFEGPLIGALLFFTIQYEFADLGAWYLIGLGLVAVAFALFLPRGAWGLLNRRAHIRLLPVGYRLNQPGVDSRRS